MSNSSKRSKPTKPRPDFPLTVGSNGQWIKKIRGRQYCFGPWDDPDGALREYLKHRDYILANGCKMPDTDGSTLRDLCNAFMEHKEQRLQTGELGQRTYNECLRTVRLMADVIGREKQLDHLTPADFAKLRQRIGTTKTGKPASLVVVKNNIGRCRSVVLFGIDEGLITKPLRQVIGRSFEMPSKRAIRVDRLDKPQRFIEAAEIRDVLAIASVQLRAMILLAVNGGFGNTDCSCLLVSDVDLDSGWIDYARRKTAVPRRVPLWRETVAALREVLEQRKETDLPNLFVTKYGRTWGTPDRPDCPISDEFRKLLRATSHYANGKNFYALRHVFETVGGDSGDQVATNAIMGHVDDSMAAVYRERISDERLLRVVQHVHGWLFDDETP